MTIRRALGALAVAATLVAGSAGQFATSAAAGEAESAIKVVDKKDDVTTHTKAAARHALDIYRFRAFVKGDYTVFVMTVRNLNKRNTEDVMLEGGWETMRANFEYRLFAPGATKPTFTIRNTPWREAALNDHNGDPVFCQEDKQQAQSGLAVYDLEANTIRYTFPTACFGDQTLLKVSGRTSTFDGGYAGDQTRKSAVALDLT